MVTAILVGLTFGLCAKFVIHGHVSSNFLGPILTGIIGSLGAWYIGMNTFAYNPVSTTALSVGSMIALGIYGTIDRKVLHHHPQRSRWDKIT